MVTKEQSIQATIDAALDKAERIRSGNAFTGDFEAARIIDALLLGLKISQAEVEKQKKLVSYYKLYISKRLGKDKEE